MHHTIKSVLITGGTHGNESSGVLIVEQYLKNNEAQSMCSSANIAFTLVNKAAIKANCRYIDEDLNRQFTPELLNLTTLPHQKITLPYEVSLAHKFNQQYGPKDQNSENSNTDFIIDIHNTTSNMGPTLIVLVNDSFHQQLARYVKNLMPEAIILLEDGKPYAENGYLCTVAKRSVMVEVGPQQQGKVEQKVLHQAKRLTESVLRFIDKYNKSELDNLPPVEAFRLGKEVHYPLNKHDQRVAELHKNIVNADFKALNKGEPCFSNGAGNEILWEEETTYPHFIGEAAYSHLDIAFATSTKILF
ncbi:aspartoacylase [Glaciecola petra]|uniref:Aspartoacylase n=1 Tax=Glaciecola petra TaxID=3075602 RepID=A0ABU2ZM84_9ALTE|nr:aspartoacylase [Aestuariibacter sp. P117]MDT0593510.1 aspartoacylase [Aestuariibacter sp. P117]